jgi:hypothetical protein
MEMARGKRPELFSSKLRQKDKRIRYPMKTDTIDMLKLLLPRGAAVHAKDHSQAGPGLEKDSR